MGRERLRDHRFYDLCDEKASWFAADLASPARATRRRRISARCGPRCSWSPKSCATTLLALWCGDNEIDAFMCWRGSPSRIALRARCAPQVLHRRPYRHYVPSRSTSAGHWADPRGGARPSSTSVAHGATSRLLLPTIAPISSARWAHGCPNVSSIRRFICLRTLALAGQ